MHSAAKRAPAVTLFSHAKTRGHFDPKLSSPNGQVAALVGVCMPERPSPRFALREESGLVSAVAQSEVRVVSCFVNRSGKFLLCG